MKKFTFILLTLSLTFAGFAFVSEQNSDSSANSEMAVNPGDGIEWITIEQLNTMVQDNSWKKNKKKVIVDLYTDWCGWCKRMDANTFGNSEIAKYIDQNFYAVKLDAESEKTIVFGNKEYKFIPGGRRGTNEIAIALGSVNGRIGYPTIVFLDEEMQKVLVSPGYKDPANMKQFLVFINEEHYKDQTWEQFQQAYNENSGGQFSD